MNKLFYILLFLFLPHLIFSQDCVDAYHPIGSQYYKIINFDSTNLDIAYQVTLNKLYIQCSYDGCYVIDMIDNLQVFYCGEFYKNAEFCYHLPSGNYILKIYYNKVYLEIPVDMP